MPAGGQRGAQAQPRQTNRSARRRTVWRTAVGEAMCAEYGRQDTMKTFHRSALWPAELVVAVAVLAL
eukprot:15472934-Alexandrium_andersonii.AAC.1